MYNLSDQDPGGGSIPGNSGQTPTPGAGGSVPPDGFTWNQTTGKYTDQTGRTWDPTSGFIAAPPPAGGPYYAPGATLPPGSPNLGVPSPTLPAGGSGGSGGGGGLGTLGPAGGNTLGGLISPFTGTPPALPGTGTPYIPSTPQFTPPSYTPYAPFSAPTAQSVLDEPGYKFGLDQGEQALQGSAAARGTLNSGGTLKDVLDYGQNYAGQHYGDAFNRSLQTYGTNLQSQNIVPYEMAFQGAQAAFAPQMTAYSTQAAAGQRANEFNTNTAMQQYQDAYNQWLAQENLKFGYRQPALTAASTP